MIGDPALAHIASSLVKDVARFGGTIDDLVVRRIEDHLDESIRLEIGAPAGPLGVKRSPRRRADPEAGEIVRSIQRVLLHEDVHQLVVAISLPSVVRAR